ncbi:hypothetical protein [Vreelandella massiliensis]|uniref:hypothetical protein n=1 Tax=Vreelandella massiliensis TaxID=1816686 RepID=UPI0011817A5E|nr:hypothetical protein [Halomonas massiliensis]
MQNSRMLPASLLASLVLCAGTNAEATTIRDSSDTTSQTTNNSTVKVVVSHSCERRWCPDVGERMKVQVFNRQAAANESPSRAITALNTTASHNPFAEPDRRLTPLAAGRSRPGATGSSQSWVNDELLAKGLSSTKKAASGFLDTDWQYGAHLRELQTMSPEAVVRKADEKAQEWLPRINNAVKGFIFPLVDKLRGLAENE